MARRRYVMDFERPLFDLEDKLVDLRRMDLSGNPDLLLEVSALSEEIERLRIETYRNLEPWDRVQIARHPERPKTEHYIEGLFTDVVELHGDRAFGDDEAIITALARFNGRKVLVMGHRKGTDTKSNIRRNFGSPQPEGFRKAIRAMKLADKFGLPIVSILDTAGAFPGIEAEERGQGWAIAESLSELSRVRVPVVAIGVGEGGSGGALAIGFGDRVLMLENSYYSVITPEACASIIYHDSGKAQDAAVALKLTAEDLLRLGIIDEIVAEPFGGAHADPAAAMVSAGEAIERALEEIGEGSDALVQSRYERLRAIGEFRTLTAEG